jgi:RHS repeat-associated protein
LNTSTREYPAILIELDPDNSNQVVKSYLYDDNSQILIQYDGSMAAGDKYFYFADRLGSIRQIIDVNGDVKHLYTHGPFGKRLESDSDPDDVYNPFGFTGQWFDIDLDLLNLRARPYVLETYRFAGRDSIWGDFQNPLTLNPYLYCQNDPINRIDPTGRVGTTAETNATVAAGTTLGAAESPQAMTFLQNTRQFVQMMSQRNWLYGQTIVRAANNSINQWTKAMNAIDQEV